MGWHMVAQAARVLLVLFTDSVAQKKKKKKSDKVDNPLCLGCKHSGPQSQKSLQARLTGVCGMIQ